MSVMSSVPSTPLSRWSLMVVFFLRVTPVTLPSPRQVPRTAGRREGGREGRWERARAREREGGREGGRERERERAREREREEREQKNKNTHDPGERNGGERNGGERNGGERRMNLRLAFCLRNLSSCISAFVKPPSFCACARTLASHCAYERSAMQCR